MRTVHVAVTPPYDMCISTGMASSVATLLEPRRTAIVTQLPALRYAKALHKLLSHSEIFLIGDGEHSKSLATVEELTRGLSGWGLRRHDVVAAVGGGIVGDVAGFAAAMYHRGVDVVQVPTTLLAMVDAAIGGKTGVNLPEGKNLLGAFHQPIAVFADLLALETVSDRDFRSGLGEVAKYAFIDGGVAHLLATDAHAILARDLVALEEVVYRTATVKASIVAIDPLERTDCRAVLNYGHSLAHALETVSAHQVTHGEAVAIGLVFAAHLAYALGRINATQVTQHAELLTTLGLPVEVPATLTLGSTALLESMARDKRSHGGLSFVLLGPDGLQRVDDPPLAALIQAFSAVGVYR